MKRFIKKAILTTIIALALMQVTGTQVRASAIG